MLFTQTHAILLLLVLFALATAKDLLVDPNLSSANDPNYPSLSEALAALLTGDSLIEATNTIRLSAACQTVPQFFLGTKIGPAGANGGSISIVYEGTIPSAINSEDACNQLPILNLTDSSYINLADLTSFSISGVNIYFNGATNLNLINNVETVTFSNTCFNNSEADDISSLTGYNYFHINKSATFTMTNGVYLFDERKKLMISEAAQVTIDSVAIIIGGEEVDGTLAAFDITSESSTQTKVNISKISITCDFDDGHRIALPKVFWISNTQTVGISTLEMSNCTMRHPSGNQQSIIAVTNTTDFNMDDLTIDELSYGGMPNQKFCFVSAVYNTVITNVKITNSQLFYAFDSKTFSGMFYFTDEVPGSSYYPMLITLKGFFINGTQIQTLSKLFYYLFNNYENFGSLSLQDFTVNQCNLTDFGYFLYLQIQVTDVVDSLSTLIKYISIGNFTFSENLVRDSVLAYFSLNSTNTKAVEVVRLTVEGFNSTGNSIVSSQLLQVEGILTHLVDSQITDDVYFNQGYFYLSKQVVSTFLMRGMTISGVTLEAYSALASANNTAPRGASFEGNFIYSNTYPKTVYVETRPFIIFQSTITNSKLLLGSTLFYSNCPEIAITESTFSQVNISDGSTLLTLGNYIPFIPAGAYYKESIYTDQTQPLTAEFYTTFTQAEISIFMDYDHDYSDFYYVLEYTRSLISYYSPTFFIAVQWNNFESIIATKSNYLIFVTNFQIQGGGTGLTDNEFSDISSSDGVNIFGHMNSPVAIYEYNSLTGGNFIGYFFYFEASYFADIFFQRNSLSDSSNCGLYSIKADECDKVYFKSSSASDLQVVGTFVDIVCTKVTRNILLYSFDFENIHQAPVPGVLNALNFISVVSKKAADDTDSTVPFIEFYNCDFYNITMENSQYLTHEIYQSSLFYVVTMVGYMEFYSVYIESVVASPRGSLIVSTATKVKMVYSEFYTIGFGSNNGAIFALLQSFSMVDCYFEDNYGLNIDGAGLIKLINSDPSNAILDVSIETSFFRNNTAPYGAILYAQNTQLKLMIYWSWFLNNQVTKYGGLIELMNISNSEISSDWAEYYQNDGYLVTYPQLKIFSLESTGQNVSFTLTNTKIEVKGLVYGVLLSTEAFHKVQINANEINFIAESVGSSSNILVPKFGFLQADNFEAHITNFKADQVKLDGTPLFTINCNMALKLSYEWRLFLNESSFDGLVLSEAVFLITSDGYYISPLDNLTLNITTTAFNNIAWSKSSLSPIAGGIIRSSTSLIGRTSPSTDFAIVVESCTFSELSGVTSLIFSTVESMFDSLLVIHSSIFTNLNTSSIGAIINPSTTKLSTFTSQLAGSVPRNNSYQITLSNITNVQGKAGCLIYWTSEVRGLSVAVEDTTISNVTCAQEGGIFYMGNGPSTTLSELTDNNSITEEHKVIVSSKKVTYQNVSAKSGGIFDLNGENRLFQINLETSNIENITVSQNGSIAQMSSSFTSASTSATNRRVLATSSIIGSFSMSGNTVLNASASNGGLIYEATANKTMQIILDINTFQSISAASRGGVLYLLQPLLIATNNIIDDFSAGYSGNLVYSVSGDFDLSALIANNTISNSSVELFSFAPTNLKVQVTSLDDGSILQLEDEDIPPYNPIVPNLTSHSLSQYQIDLTLVYKGSQDYQVVIDEFTKPQLTLVFKSLTDGSIQEYVSNNCSNSTCTALPSAVVLKGNAGDLVLVNATYTSNNYTQFQQFYIRLRSCVPGELNITGSLVCTYCKAGTYSLNTSDLRCNNCPEGATCHGGANISIGEGYYRSKVSQAALLILNCNDSKQRCEGGFNNSCKEPFTGPACLQCDLGKKYIPSTSEATCYTCHEKSKLIGLAVVLLLSSVVYQIVMVIVTYRENRGHYLKLKESKEQNQKEVKEVTPGEFMVIYSTFSQIAATLGSMDVGAVESVISASENVGNSNTQVLFSLQCLYLAFTPDSFQGLQFQILVYVLSPLVKVLVVVLFEIIRGLIFKDKEGKGKKKALIRIGSVAVVLILLEQPAIIGILCEYLSCTRLDPLVEEYYIKSSSNVQCYTDKYNFFARLFVIPALVFWAFVVPAVIFVFLYKKRAKLQDSEAFHIVLGNFYTCYSQRAPYWGVAILIFKMIIFVFNSVFNVSNIFKGVIFMMVVHIYYYYLKKTLPYNNARLIFAEKFCCIAYMVVLTFVFVRESSEVDAIQVICSVCIFISIVVAAAYILINIAILYTATFFTTAKNLKGKLIERKKQRTALEETLRNLKQYHHDENPDRLDGAGGRRKAIAIELSSR